MTRAENTEVIDKFEQFYRDYYRNEIGELAQKYPNEQRSLYIDWEDLYRFDPDIADDIVAHPDQMLDYAEEALRLYDLPVDVKLGHAHVRVQNLPVVTAIQNLGAQHRGQLIGINGIVQTATEVKPVITEAAYECQRCGTLSRIPQTFDELHEPHECQGCERQGPFNLNFDQSEFTEGQTLRVFDNPTDLPSGTMPGSIEVHLMDDIAGAVTPGDSVRITGVVHLDQDQGEGEGSTVFEPYMDAIAIEPPNEESVGSESQTQPPTVSDTDSYTDLAASVLSTLPENVREEETKAKLITPFIEALGWNKFDNSEVRLEYTDLNTTLRVDYALFGPASDSPDVVVEAKQRGTPLEDKEEQLQNYLRVFSAEWGVLSNGEKYFVFRQRDDELPEKLTEIRISDVSNAGILDSLRRGTFYDR